jgi:EAL domain-containing protein (putative c-di-GMP-specific phosphodiesterase class I)/GGDEF domain-containing protein
MDDSVVGNVAGTEMTATRPAESPAVRRSDAEPLLLGLLAAGGFLAAWSSGAGRAPWTAATTIAVLAGSAELARRRDPRPPTGSLRATRAALALAAATVAVGVHPRPALVMLAWFPAVCAVFTALLPAAAAATLTTAALGVLMVLAYDAPDTGTPSATAFVACAVAVLAVSLASRTVRAVLAVLAARVPADSGANSTTSAAGSPGSPGAAPPEPAAPAYDPDADPLRPAGIPGQAQLLEAVTKARSRAGVVGGHLGLVVVTVAGVDGLSRSLGVRMAGEVLEILARRARAWLPAGDVVAWLGEGRFAALLEGVDVRTCSLLAHRLSALLAEPVEIGREVLSLPCVAGVALAEAADEAPEAFLARAVGAPALTDGELLTPPAAAGAAPDLVVEELWSALSGGQVTVALQPIVALGTLARLDRVVALEALARWTRPDGVSVPPARFVPVARRAGLADLLGATVLARGLDAVARRRAAGNAALGLNVNVAPEQLTGEGFASTILQALDRSDVDPAALTVEVPATAAFEDTAAGRTALEALRAGGVGVVLDHFGATGLSIGALRDLPLTGVKLDRSLTAELGADDRLVVATVRLATRLGLTCTAVGIETQAQLDAARSLGLDTVQGHLLGRPEAEHEDDDRPAVGAEVVRA